MKVQYDKDVLGAPGELFALLTDEAFLGAYAARTGSIRYDIGVHHADGVTTTRVSRTLPTDAMPAVARRFVGRTLDVVEIVAWCSAGADVWHGDAAVDIAVAGRDARFRGRAVVEPRQDESRYTLHGDVTIKVPLVGGTVEKLAADALVKAANAQVTAAQETLQGS